jgi:hypothetical protein
MANPPNRYAGNQFYNIEAADPNVTNSTKSNPDFIWPGPSQKNAVLGSPGSTYPVERGYMRLLTNEYTTVNGSLSPSRRLNFQFNPDTLTRSVSARNDIQYWMNQDPFQLTQPTPGDANFGFDLMFNREAEIASSSYRTQSGITKVRSDADLLKDRSNGLGARPDIGLNLDAYDPSWVTDIGVLADLMVFDQLIGQGINSDIIDQIAKQAVTSAKAYNNSEGVTSDATDKSLETDEAIYKTYLEANLGNSAFLIAQPIRVVFSSLFMVEGFVTNTSVLFNKFNHAMVPTQCTISVNMTAMYIGFAQPKTYLTKLYEDFDKQAKADADAVAGEQGQLVSVGNLLVEKNGYRSSTNITKVLSSFNVKDLLISGGNLTALSMRPTPTLKEWAKAGTGKLTAKATIQVVYRGQTGGGSAGGYAVGSTVYNGTSQPITIANSSISTKPWVDLAFQFTTQKSTIALDQSASALFNVTFQIRYYLEGPGGKSIQTSEFASGGVVVDASTLVYPGGEIKICGRTANNNKITTKNGVTDTVSRKYGAAVTSNKNTGIK